jgi:putative flippase GtrA
MVLMKNKHLMFSLPFFFQLLRFGIVGLSAAATQFCLVVVLVEHRLCVPLMANFFAFIIAFQVSYWGHRLWTFNAGQTRHSTALPRLLFVQILNFTANETLFYIFLSLKWPYPIALLMVLTVLPFFTFLSSKLWVFRPSEN